MKTENKFKMNNDTMLTLLDAWLSAEEGINPSEAIERQEKRGQDEVVRKQRLPKKINSNSIPNELLLKDITPNMDYDTRKIIEDRNLIDYTREQYEKMGIEIIDEYDDLFWNVKLPEGWKIKATDHTMWNELRDNKDRKRAIFFYKAAFYDRDAFIRFETRFNLSVDKVAPSDAEYEVWEKSDFIGTIKDGDVIISQTRTVPPSGDYFKDNIIKKELWEELETFMKDHYSDYKNIHAYWD